jgi:hypothetical protein
MCIRTHDTSGNHLRIAVFLANRNMSLPRPLPAKKDVALMLLQTSDVFIHLDPRCEKVLVPPHLKHKPHLILQIGLNMPVAIPDLDVGEEGVSCTLSFSRSPFWCKVPWNAVYALVSEDRRGMVWPDDVPPEVALQFVRDPPPEQAQVAPPAPVAEPATKRGARATRAKGTGKRKQAATRTESPTPEAPPTPRSVAALPPNGPLSQPSDASPPSKTKRPLPPYLRVVK